MAKLIRNDPSNGPVEFQLEGDEWVVGRNPGCRIPIHLTQVSRNHARITREGDTFYIEDLGSRNHTWINKSHTPDHLLPHKKYRLNNGDVITFCDVDFVFRDDTEGSTQDSGTRHFPTIFEDDDPNRQSSIDSRLEIQRLTDSSRLVVSPAMALEAILSISRLLGRSLALDEVLPQVLDGLFRIFLQADRGIIALLDDEGNLYTRWAKARREGMGDFRVSRTIANEAMNKKQAILSTDATTDDRFDMSQSLADLRIRSLMCYPLLDIDDQPMGILQLDTIDHRKQFRPEDLSLLSAVGSQASIAIDNARLHEEALKHQKVQRELQLAREVQGSFLPDAPPEIPGFEFFHHYQPANHVGGDYFDYVHLPNGRLSVIVADVVGHGVAAALLVAKLSAEIRYCLASIEDPGAAITELNRRMMSIPPGQFITMIMVVIDPSSHAIQVVNAGHMAPFMRGADGTVRELMEEEGSFPLGVMDDTEYPALTAEFNPGELMLLFTDGINESANADDELLGLDAIRQELPRAGETAEQVVNYIVQLATRHAAQQDDDMCAVAVRRTNQ